LSVVFYIVAFIKRSWELEIGGGSCGVGGRKQLFDTHLFIFNFFMLQLLCDINLCIHFMLHHIVFLFMCKSNKNLLLLLLPLF